MLTFLLLPIAPTYCEDHCQATYTSLSENLDHVIASHQQGTPAFFDALHNVEEALFSAFQQCPDNPLLLSLMGETQISLGNAQLAYLYAKKAITLKGSYWQTNHLLGTTLCLQGNYSEGVQYLEVAARLAPHKPLLLFNLCSAYYAAKQYEKAVQTCTVFLARQDHKLHGPAYHLRAQSYQALGKTKQARQDFNNARVLEYSPPH